MQKSAPSRLSKLLNLIEQANLDVSTKSEIYFILADHQQDIYSLLEDMKRMTATCRQNAADIASLNKRYSELLYRFSELRK